MPCLSTISAVLGRPTLPLVAMSQQTRSWVGPTSTSATPDRLERCGALPAPARRLEASYAEHPLLKLAQRIGEADRPTCAPLREVDLPVLDGQELWVQGQALEQGIIVGEGLRHEGRWSGYLRERLGAVDLVAARLRWRAVRERPLHAHSCQLEDPGHRLVGGVQRKVLSSTQGPHDRHRPAMDESSQRGGTNVEASDDLAGALLGAEDRRERQHGVVELQLGRSRSRPGIELRHGSDRLALGNERGWGGALGDDQIGVQRGERLKVCRTPEVRDPPAAHWRTARPGIPVRCHQSVHWSLRIQGDTRRARRACPSPARAGS